MSKAKPVIGKERMMINHEGTKEVLTNVIEFKNIKEIRVDFDDNCVKVMEANSKAYEVVFEDTNKEQLIQFQRFLVTAMSGITQDEIIKARQMAQQAQAAMKKSTGAKDTKNFISKKK